MDDSASGEEGASDERRVSSYAFPLSSEQDSMAVQLAKLKASILIQPVAWLARREDLSSFLCLLLAKTLPPVTCLHENVYNDDEVAISSSDPIWFHPIFGIRPLDSIPAIVVFDDLESIDQINDPWDFVREVEALKCMSFIY
ncbi:uncharacterized protein ARMOST_16895 [Armillaria ostoyae]|uniref:Uncharacterized protein n=1 Tax=Armillaria ostoyae TaxID=47428 RepID=A0A284RXG9_ARMOS|nr:uncharacterized protein ARMOST_16895 [Armillaria ostoyae]